MPVVLTQEVEGLNVGDTYTGADEAYLLASGYADQDGYTGPGIQATGAADTTIANNREFDATRGQIAKTSDLPEGATNDGIVLKNADAPFVDPQGSTFGDPETTSFNGFANDPAEFPTSISGLSKTVGKAGDVVKVYGTGLADSTGVTFGGVAGTSVSHQGDKQITVTVPAHADGVVDVVVQDPDGNKTLTGGFTYDSSAA